MSEMSRERGHSRVWADDTAYEEYAQDRANPLTGKRFLHAIKRHVACVVWNRLGNDDEDVVAEIVARIFTKEQTHFAGRSKFSTWAHRIATNYCNSLLRKRYRYRELSLDNIPERDWRRLRAVNAGGQFLLRKELEEKLTGKERDLLKRKLDKESEKEIASAWSSTISSVRNRWYRLRQKLLLLV